MPDFESMPGEVIQSRFSQDDYWKKALSGRTVCIQTFGCAYNEGDSDLLASVLKDFGSTITADPEDAEVVILNTCIVIGATERKMQKVIYSYRHKEVYLTGCLPLAFADFLKENPHIGFIHPDSIHQAVDDTPRATGNRVQVVQVGPGCAGSCRYCITRIARGSIRSIPEPVILSHIEDCARNGTVEIRMAGQDLSAYGLDTNRWSLASLLDDVPSLPETTRIRLGMMNPKTLLPIAGKVAKAMKKGPFFQFLHLPVQSGSDHILEQMERGYQVTDILHIIDLFRSEMSGITIATDIIAGYPGEYEEDHEQTMNLLSLMKPGMVNVTRYSWRPGTGMDRENELPDRIRKDRSRAVVKASYAQLHAANTRKIGMILEVLTTEQVRPGSVMARSNTYEGVVIGGDIPLGQWYSVRITGCTPHYLSGELLR